MQKVLIICTANSCRSIIAEAIINYYKGNKFLAFSAGSHASGKVDEDALKCLMKHGIKTDQLKSKSWNLFANQEFDYIITVCDAVAKEPLPYFSGNYKKIHWSIPDPSLSAGNQLERSKAFDNVFSLLFKRIDLELI